MLLAAAAKILISRLQQAEGVDTVRINLLRLAKPTREGRRKLRIDPHSERTRRRRRGGVGIHLYAASTGWSN